MLAALPANLRAARQKQHPSYSLVLQSSDLPEKDRQDILNSIDVSACPVEVVSEMIVRKARDLGYLQAAVQEQKSESENRIQLTENITAGVRYRLRTLKVVKATLFTPDQLRSEVPIATGEIFSLSQFVKGLDRIRHLYATKGYIDAVAIPEPAFDPEKRLVNLTLEIDEGLPYHFGALLLNGAEPRPGAAKQLTASWKPLRGQLFNPSVIANWLQANKASCPSCTERDLTYTERNISSPSNFVDITLQLPPHPLQ